ncbi:GIY-YIG nuclease family protein [Roseibium sp. RKSG952]|uniref:GIY-YIG nuclease family protein n=1 Tax=Roseibium sp. RKSG952 TaxID=2529384 RepID=UPI0012BBA8C5|nr:GIY-YIG nuclease family protein [Roseibium sp. RKSG952]MTH98384.1 GIY-YIG nuclease family protein [Roseibium sp. RKSG952]
MSYFVYVLASGPQTDLYTGLTEDLLDRTRRHRSCAKQGRTPRLVYFETFERLNDAAAREKRLKALHRDWQIDVVEAVNPDWRDLFPSLEAKR